MSRTRPIWGNFLLMAGWAKKRNILCHTSKHINYTDHSKLELDNWMSGALVGRSVYKGLTIAVEGDRGRERREAQIIHDIIINWEGRRGEKTFDP